MSQTKLLYQNDLPGQYPQSWYAATVDAFEPQARLSESLNCDVCIVGGGFTGLSAALTLARDGMDVVLLDAHRVGWGASGRNGGQLGSGQRVDQDVLEKKYGAAHAHALWDLAQASKQNVHNLIEQYGIECDYQPGIMYVDHKRRFSRDTAEYVEKLNTNYGYDQISFADRDEIRQRIASDRYYSGSIDTGAGHLHPLKLATGIARAALQHGVRIFENTEVTSYSDSPEQVTIKSKYGDIKARQLLLACNGYLGDLASDVAASVMPINNYIIATEKLEPSLAASLIRDNMAVADSKFVVNYFRVSTDNRLLFGGRESYGYRFPANIKSFVRSAMLSVYPQLEDTGIDYGWGGTLAITMNRMPHIRQLSTNVMSSSGYSGHGVGMATLSGKLCAEAVADRFDSFNVMAKLDHMKFPGGTLLRSPLLKLGMMYYSLRDRL